MVHLDHFQNCFTLIIEKNQQKRKIYGKSVFSKKKKTIVTFLIHPESVLTVKSRDVIS